MRRLLPLLVAALGVAALLSGCAGSGTAGVGSTGEPIVVHVDISGKQVSPHGDTVNVPLGSQVELDIQADANGEIHVHSRPEQTIDYHAGTTQATLAAFTAPGRVTVEVHTLKKTVVTLRVR